MYLGRHATLASVVFAWPKTIIFSTTEIKSKFVPPDRRSRSSWVKSLKSKIKMLICWKGLKIEMKRFYSCKTLPQSVSSQITCPYEFLLVSFAAVFCVVAQRFSTCVTTQLFGVSAKIWTKGLYGSTTGENYREREKLPFWSYVFP